MRNTLPELLAMLKSLKAETKEEHQVLMVNKTTTFNTGQEWKEG
jgi:hypothetical protein